MKATVTTTKTIAPVRDSRKTKSAPTSEGERANCSKNAVANIQAKPYKAAPSTLANEARSRKNSAIREISLFVGLCQGVRVNSNELFGILCSLENVLRG